ncbi:MAG: hypothetical protein JW918_07275 [Anaerolineae bacterium]|nr:hypothetical protein [Anaerolineae bacterium]
MSVMLLAACASGQATQVADESVGGSYTSEVLDTSYEGALGVSDQLMLGTLLLEATEHAVTPEQAETLLPLWQALQGGVTIETEVNAVLKQIEGTMTQEQLQAIARLQLTQEDLQAWMEEQGMGGAPGAGPGGPGGGGDMSDEEREAARATWQAGSDGGGMPPGGGEMPPGGGEMPPEMATRQAEFANMTDAEREAARATMQAGGGFPGGAGGAGGRGASGGRQANFLLSPLIQLLEERAGGG